jgi:hypothetical protein
MYNRTANNQISRFIGEIPPHTAEYIKLTDREKKQYASFSAPKKQPPRIPEGGEFSSSYRTAGDDKIKSSDYTQMFTTYGGGFIKLSRI